MINTHTTRLRSFRSRIRTTISRTSKPFLTRSTVRSNATAWSSAKIPETDITTTRAPMDIASPSQERLSSPNTQARIANTAITNNV